LSHDAEVYRILREVWGYDAFRPLQSAAIDCVLAGRDSLTVLPTGGGKSLCFQVPALCLEGMAVVVSPLISLMKDQVDALVACGVPAAFVNSSQSVKEKREVAERIGRGDIKLLYVAPERLLNARTIEFLQQCRVSLFAIDEAHCISNWGHDFRPEYRGLRILKQHFPKTAVHAYTATASESVRQDIVAQLGLDQPQILVGSFDRPNLIYRMWPADDRLRQVTEVIKRHAGEAGIVYCISRKEVERTTAALVAMGTRALAYHAGLDDQQRQTNQDAFLKEKCDVMVATVAFGMGIDKSNVRYVVHAGMPKSIEHYQQESGRAGRDGLESECVLIYSGGDVMTWKKIMEGSGEGNGGALRALEAIGDLCQSPTCRHRSLVEYFGEPYERDNCGACDVCLNELELAEDPITLSQKILSCVLRLEQRFGVAHTVKVLTGANDARIRDLGHDRLSTYNLLAAEGAAAVRTWIGQLIQQGFLRREGEYAVLSVTHSGRRLLRRDGAPKLSVPRPSSSRSSRSERANTRSTTVSRGSADSDWSGVDRGLFEGLRKLRSTLAGEMNVPAYVVFSDNTLRELARHRPNTLEQFARIKGVGERKLQDYGEAFVAAIAEHSTHSPTP